MEFASVEMSLVKGNHDAHVGALPSNWPFTIIDPGQMIDVVAIGHHPGEMPKGASIYLCGHIHPAVRIASRTEGLGRLPCFWYSCGQMVLPAIGEFTGSHLVKPSADDDLWIIGDNQIFSYSKTTIQ